MVSKFKDGEIDHVLVTDEAKTISWLREDDGALIGINVSSAQNMRILMDEKGISQIRYYHSVDETLFPEKDLKEDSRYLEGFIWLEDSRPKSRRDVIPGG